MAANRLDYIVAEMERRRREYGLAVEDFRRVASSAAPMGDAPAGQAAAARRDLAAGGGRNRRGHAGEDAATDIAAASHDRVSAHSDAVDADPVADLGAQARRRYQRQSGVRIQSSLAVAGHAQVRATLVDISRGGAAFECRWDARPGMDVIIEFAGLHRRVRARVVRSANAVVAVSFLKDNHVPAEVAHEAPPGPAQTGGPGRADGDRAAPRGRQLRPTYRLRAGYPSGPSVLSRLAGEDLRADGPLGRPTGAVRAVDAVRQARTLTRELEALVGRMRDQREQRLRLAAAALGGLCVGALLWLALVTTLPSAASDWLVALPLGGGPWGAGQALMRRDSPEAWDRMVRLSTACGDQAVALCERAMIAARPLPPLAPTPR